MQKISLLIQPVLTDTQESQSFVNVDLMEQELITLTQVIQDVKDIEKIFTDFSKTFNLPASKTNNKLFQNWYNPDVVGFNNQTMCNAKIELNHSEFKSGKIRLENVVMKNNRPSIYKVTFFGNTVSLTDLMQDDNLDVLSWLNNFNIIQTPTNVLNGLKDGLDFTVDSITYTDAVIFPLITHTQQYVLNYSSDGNNPNNIAANNNTNITRRGVLPEDLKPAIKVQLIIKAIEQQYGLTFKTGEFFDSSAVANMYLWLHRDKGKLALAGTWLGNVDAYSCSGANCSTLGNLSNRYGHVDTSTGIIHYKPLIGLQSGAGLPDPGFYKDNKATITVEVTPASGFESVIYDLEIVNYITSQSVAVTQNLSGTNQLSISLNENFNNLQFVGRVTSVEVFQFQFKITYNRTLIYNKGLPPQAEIHVENAVFTSTSSSLTPTGGLITITDNVPEIKVIDFLKGIFKMHNLTAFINTDNEIVIKTLNSFYAGGSTLDLTEYIDTTQHSIESTLPFSEVKFEYPEPKTILAQEFLNLNNRRFGSLDFLSKGSATKKYEIKAPFEHMMFQRLFSGTEATQVIYGAFIDEELKSTIGAPLLFFANNVIIDDEDYEINFVDSTRPADGGLVPAGTRTSLSRAWLPNNTDIVNPSTSTKPNFELHFGSEINSYSLTDYSGITNSLFNLYYKSYIERVFNIKTRLYKFKALLPLGILLELSLDDKILVGTHCYTINKMTTKLQSGETELELLSEAYD